MAPRPRLCNTELPPIISLQAPPAQSLGVFTGVVVIVSVGSLVVTLNAKLLGGRVWVPQTTPYLLYPTKLTGRVVHVFLRSSFFQSLCVLGYCIFPLVIAALVSTFFHALYVRGPVSLTAWAWCVWGMCKRCTSLEERDVSRWHIAFSVQLL